MKTDFPAGENGRMALFSGRASVTLATNTRHRPPRPPDAGAVSSFAPRRFRKGFGVVLSLCAVTLLLGSGCAARINRDYGRIPFQPAQHFKVQLLLPEGNLEEPLEVSSLLLLPPIGSLTPEMQEILLLSLWKELQQILPGVVRTPIPNGAFSRYTDDVNIIASDGSVYVEELQRIGQLANASHLLSVRVIEHRPYHPQRMIMEWHLLDVESGRSVLVMAGGLDAAEQRVLIAADGYLRKRQAVRYNTGNLDVMLRSPRAYSGFAVAQAVDALRGRVQPDKAVIFRP